MTDMTYLDTSYIWTPYIPLQVSPMINDYNRIPSYINGEKNYNNHWIHADGRIRKHYFGENAWMLASGIYQFDCYTSHYNRGMLHRLDGPAYDSKNYQYYYYYGKGVTIKELYQKVKDTCYAPKLMAYVLGYKTNESTLK